VEKMVKMEKRALLVITEKTVFRENGVLIIFV
jgi:hypothetical protein